jgi:hypothetical protein
MKETPDYINEQASTRVSFSRKKLKKKFNPTTVLDLFL